MTHIYRTTEPRWSIHGEEFIPPYDQSQDRLALQQTAVQSHVHHQLQTIDKALKRQEGKSQYPQGRYGHRCVQASYMGKNVMIMFGGYNCQEVPRRLDDLWEYDLDRHIWEKIEFPEGGTVPPARDCHGAVLYKHEMYITAGGTGFVWLDDMFAYNLITKTWRRVDCTGDRPSGRAGHSANVHGDKMFVFAGWNGRRTLNDMHVFDFATSHWERVEYTGMLIPECRDSHAAVVANGNLYIVGGGDGRVRLNDMWEFSIETREWRRFECMGGVTAGRAGHVCCLYQKFNESKIIMFGGGNGEVQGGWMTEIYECDLNARKWSLIAPPEEDQVAPGCYGLSAIIYKNSMFVFGGGDGENWYNSVYQYRIDEPCADACTKFNLQSNLHRKAFVDLEVFCQDDLCHWMTDDSDDCEVDEGDVMMLDSDSDSSMRSPIPARQDSSTSTSKTLAMCHLSTPRSPKRLPAWSPRKDEKSSSSVKRSRTVEPKLK